jgi:hypothetical protein
MEAPQQSPRAAAPAAANASLRQAFARRIDCAPKPRSEPPAQPPSSRGGTRTGPAPRDGA